MVFLSSLSLLLGLLPAAGIPQDGESTLRSLLYRDGSPEKVKDLGPEWTIATFVRESDSKPGRDVFAAIDASFQPSKRSTVVTRWETISAGSQKYIVCYRIAPTPKALVELFQQMDRPGEVKDLDSSKVIDMLVPPATPDSPLRLELIDTESILSIDNIGRFDAANVPRDTTRLGSSATMAAILFPVFAQARAKARATSSLSNLKQMGTAIMMYAQDYDERLPPMASLDQMKKATFPYTKNDSLYKCPIPGLTYVTNPRASKVPFAAVRSPVDFILVYESQADGSGSRGVLFGDGHAKRVLKAAWADVWKKGQAP